MVDFRVFVDTQSTQHRGAPSDASAAHMGWPSPLLCLDECQQTWYANSYTTQCGTGCMWCWPLSSICCLLVLHVLLFVTCAYVCCDKPGRPRQVWI